MRSLLVYVQDALSPLKTDDLEVLSEEADHIIALLRKSQVVVCSAQQPQAK